MTDNVVYFGTIIWFKASVGYGFITYADSVGKLMPDIFLHYSDLVMEGYKTINKGDKVSFQIGLNNRGQPKAVNVCIIP